MKKISFILLLSAVFIASVLFLHSKTSAQTNTISGYVKDQNDQAISGASVSATHATETGGCPFGPHPQANATSDSNGYYSLTIDGSSGSGYQSPCNYVNLSFSKNGCTFSSPAVPLFPLQTATKNISGNCGSVPKYKCSGNSCVQDSTGTYTTSNCDNQCSAAPTPSTAPSNLTATALSCSQVQLSWQDNSSNETGFKIERKQGAAGSWSQIATVAANVISYIDSSLTGGVSYSYRVSAYSSAQPPPTPPPTPPPSPGGKWTQQVASARPINVSDGYLYKLFKQTIDQGKTYYYLIDPNGFNTGYISAVIGIGVVDPTQSQYINIYYPMVYRLDRNNNELARYAMTGSGDFGINIKYYTQEDYDNGVKFLIEIIEKGMGSGSVDLSWRWK